MANRTYQAEFRKKKWIPFEERVAPTERPQCGSPRGRDLHAYHGELSCEACRISGNKRIRVRDEKNPEQRWKRSRKWHLENPELSRLSGKKWREANPEKIAAKNRKQRAVKAGVISETYSAEDILREYGEMCHICGENVDLNAPRHPGGGEGWELGLQLDHVIPLSKGGADTIDNVKPSHAKCNLIKQDRDQPRPEVL